MAKSPASLRPAARRSRAAPPDSPESPATGVLPTLRRLYDRIRSKPKPAAPGAHRILRGRHDTPQGSRNYRLFIPGTPRAGGNSALVLMLHGCNQTPDSFALGTRMNLLAEARGVYVLWPEQPRYHNRLRCWNWFDPEHQTADAGEPAILASMVRAIAADYGIPQGRLFVAGLSAGGAMTEVLCATHPSLFAAAGIHSGLPAGAARSKADAAALMKEGPVAPPPATGGPRRIIFQGDADKTVDPGNGRAIAASIGMGRVTTGTTQDRTWTRSTGPRGEFWMLHGAGHAWSGGNPADIYASAAGPDASAEMLRFFLNPSEAPP